MNKERLKEMIAVLSYSAGLGILSFFIVRYMVLTTPGAYMRFDLLFVLTTAVSVVPSTLLYTLQGISKTAIVVTLGMNFVMILMIMLIIKT